MTAALPSGAHIRRRLKLKDLDTLLTVIQTGSMGKAAAALNTSQPAVSKAIADLEHALGVRLLDRSRQGVEPTPYGRALVKRGVAVFDELRQGAEDIAFLADPTSGEVRLAGSEVVASAIIAPVIERLSRQYPKMSFRVLVGDLRVLLRDLDARRLDLVMSRIPDALSEEYSVEVLFDDPMVVVAGPGHPLARRRKVEIAELLDHPWTLQPYDSYFGSLVAEAFRRNGFAPPPLAVPTTSFHLRDELVATGRFLSMVPGFSVLLPRRHPSLKIVPVEFPGARHPFAIVTLKNRSLSPATQVFIERVRAITRPL